MSPSSQPFVIGEVVAEHYEILEVIGTGATGVVYRARDLYADARREIVALKAIHRQLHGDRQIFGRFRREAAILSKLEGPHVCKLLEVVEQDGLLMLAIEYVDGPSLDGYLREGGPLPLGEAVAIMDQVCEALETAHAAGVIHRDLKPSNVLIAGVRARAGSHGPASFRRELRARVVDFGLAKLIKGEQSGTALTEHDMIFGTPDYMSPEQVAGEQLDARCDVYAAAVMLYEMLVGRVPFETPGALTTMAAHLNQPVPSPRAAAPERDIPASVEAVVVKAMAKKPADRYPGARALAEALRAAVAVSGDDAAASSGALAAVDTQRDAAALSSTLASHQDAVMPASSPRGARVRVVVSDAPSQPSSKPGSSSPPTEPSSRGGASRLSLEPRLWAVLAVLLALGAIAVGVWLGL